MPGTQRSTPLIYQTPPCAATYGQRRDLSNPFPGPVELQEDVESILVWPLREGARVLKPVIAEIAEEEEVEPR